MTAQFWLTAPTSVHTLPQHVCKQADRLEGPSISFERRKLMRLALPVVIAGGCFAAVLTATGAAAQDIKIGMIYDLTGPFAGGGSKPACDRQQDRHRHDQREGRRRGLQDRCRRCGRAIQGRCCDQRGRAAAQRGQGRPADGRLLQRAMRAAGREGRRRQEVHVDERVRRPPRCSRTRTCTYVFRPTVHSDQYGEASCIVHRRERQDASSARTPKDVKVAIIHEDGPYGVGVAAATRSVQGARHADRAQGGLFGHRARSVRAW